MLKLVIVILAAVIATIFAIDNMDHVEFSLGVGKPVHVRLFFLLMTAFLLGCFSAVFMSLYLRARGSKKHKAADKDNEDAFF